MTRNRSHARLRLGQPRLRGNPKGPPWTPPADDLFAYAIDWPNESATAAGFEYEFVSSLLRNTTGRNDWGIFPELPLGYWYLVYEWANGSTTVETDDPVDGDRYWSNNGSGAGTYFVEIGFLDHGFTESLGGNTVPYLSSAWPPSGPILAGQKLRWRIAHRSTSTASLGMDFAWIGSDGNTISTDFIPFTPQTTWTVARTASIATIGSLPDEEVSAELTAPTGAVQFSLVVKWAGIEDAEGRVDFDALRIEVTNP